MLIILSTAHSVTLLDDFARMGPDRIAATARREGIRYLVIVKTSSVARDAVLKVKDVASTSEKEGT